VVKAVDRSRFPYQLYSQVNLQTVPGTAGTGSHPPAGEAGNLSRNVPGTGNSEILIIDQMGILASLYSFADVVFVGGSLVGRGGQNPIEAASSKKPIVHGPYVFNFENVYQKLNGNHAAFQIQSEEELFERLKTLLVEPKLREEMGERAWTIVQSMKGATARTLDYLAQWVKPVGARRTVPLQLGERTT
jgi:3-deoxy-D-manno-octulosonic-acid transferase